MLGKRLTRHLFADPSHRRDDLLLGFGFGTIWLLISFGHNLTMPYILIPLSLFARGIAESLPRSWIFLTVSLRLVVLFGSVIAIIWFALLFFGWLQL